MTYEIIIEGTPHRLDLARNGETWDCKLDGDPITVNAVYSRPNVISLIINGRAFEVKRELSPNDLHIWVGGARYHAEVRDPRSLRSRRSGTDTAKGPRKLAAPMPGKVVRVLVAEGEKVDAGQGIIVVEAMKMQNELKSPKQGVIRKLMVGEGASVNPGDVLAIID